MSKQRLVFALCITAAACKTEYPHAQVGLRLATPSAMKQIKPPAKHVTLPFLLAEQGVNGTALVFAYLQRVESEGALYASDLSYAIQVRHNGTAIECVSKIRLDDGAPPPAAPVANTSPDDVPEYSTTVKPFQPDAVDTWVTDRDLACQQHATQVVSQAPAYDSTYMPELGGHLEMNPIRYKSDIVYYDACGFEAKRKYVHRYEHFIAARFTPPDLPKIAQRYADLELVEEPPLCHQIVTQPGKPLVHHIEADVVYGNPRAIPQVEAPLIPNPGMYPVAH